RTPAQRLSARPEAGRIRSPARRALAICRTSGIRLGACLADRRPRDIGQALHAAAAWPVRGQPTLGHEPDEDHGAPPRYSRLTMSLALSSSTDEAATAISPWTMM